MPIRENPQKLPTYRWEKFISPRSVCQKPLITQCDVNEVSKIEMSWWIKSDTVDWDLCDYVINHFAADAEIKSFSVTDEVFW